jgi:ABC-type transport system involved in cytochrome c biogenesis permease component
MDSDKTSRKEIDPVQERLKQMEDKLHLLNVQFLKRFYFFFTGLVFAVLSFAIQYPVKTTNLFISIGEAISWVLLAIAGFLALREIGAFHLKDTKKALESLKERQRWCMWASFIAGVGLLLAAKSAGLIYGAYTLTRR